MSRPKIVPGSVEHARLISPSKVASICNVAQVGVAYTLWLRMKGLHRPQAAQDIFTVGLAFEGALAYLWKEDHPGWRLSPGEVQYVTDRVRLPVSAPPSTGAPPGQARRIVEMKIAHRTDEWGDVDLAGDCPADYVLQVIAQQLFTGLRAPADLIVMGPFFKHRTYTVEFDTQIANWMLVECRAVLRLARRQRAAAAGRQPLHLQGRQGAAPRHRRQRGGGAASS